MTTALAESVLVVGPPVVGGQPRVLGSFTVEEGEANLPQGVAHFAFPTRRSRAALAEAPDPLLYTVILSAVDRKVYLYCLLVHECWEGVWVPRCIVVVSTLASAGLVLYLESLFAELSKAGIVANSSPARGARRRARRVKAVGHPTNGAPASAAPSAVRDFVLEKLRRIAALPPEVPLPKDGSPVRMELAGRTFTVAIPTDPFPFEPRLLLGLVPAEDVLRLLEASLAETSVLFVSDCTWHLVAACEILLGLLRPFQWQGAYVPVISFELADLLDAPVPLLGGAHGDVFEEELASRVPGEHSVTEAGEGLVVCDLRPGHERVWGSRPRVGLPTRAAEAIGQCIGDYLHRSADLYEECRAAICQGDVLRLKAHGSRRVRRSSTTTMQAEMLARGLRTRVWADEDVGEPSVTALAHGVSHHLQGLAPQNPRGEGAHLLALADARRLELGIGGQRALFARQLSQTQLFSTFVDNTLEGRGRINPAPLDRHSSSFERLVGALFDGAVGAVRQRSSSRGSLHAYTLGVLGWAWTPGDDDRRDVPEDERAEPAPPESPEAAEDTIIMSATYAAALISAGIRCRAEAARTEVEHLAACALRVVESDGGQATRVTAPPLPHELHRLGSSCVSAAPTEDAEVHVIVHHEKTAVTNLANAIAGDLTGAQASAVRQSAQFVSHVAEDAITNLQIAGRRSAHGWRVSLARRKAARSDNLQTLAELTAMVHALDTAVHDVVTSLANDVRATAQGLQAIVDSCPPRIAGDGAWTPLPDS